MYLFFCKREWHHLRALEIVRHWLCPKLPLPWRTHTRTYTQLTLSVLIEAFHSHPCKHPARVAGARILVAFPMPQNKSPLLYTLICSCLPPHVVCCLCPAGSQESDSSQTAKKDMLAALRARQEALEDTLKKRLEELKNICIREAVWKTTVSANI